ncbi:conserved protein, unknown function [Hepatocystis sp. ex Piliocolobus tephrosceles]|nr:conserved protein, unknown function [Hepatocystis sp. ex Piliocolobus tephrosceles]
MICFRNIFLRNGLIKRNSFFCPWSKEKIFFSSQRIPIICVKTINDIKQMISYIEYTYSCCEEKKKHVTFENYFKNKDLIGFLYTNNDYKTLYDYWNDFHIKCIYSMYKKDKKEKNNFNNVDYEKYTYLNSVFKLCSDEDNNMNIMNKNIIGIYIPEHKNIYSVNINYFYIFKNLKELMKGKLFYELYLILPNCIFLISYVDIFIKLIYYKKVIEYAKKEIKKKKKNETILQKTMKCNLLIKIYRHKKNMLKNELKNELEKIFSDKKYIKIIYEDSIELSLFLYNFLKINSFNFIDLQHLYQYIIKFYELKILKNNIYTVIPVLFPEEYNNTLIYEYKKIVNMHKNVEHNTGKQLRSFEIEKTKRLCDIQNSHNKLEKHDKLNDSDGNTINKYFKSKKQIPLIYNINIDNNKLLNFEKDLVQILFIFPCAHKLLIKYNDLEGYNISYKMNELIEKYKYLNCYKKKNVHSNGARINNNNNDYENNNNVRKGRESIVTKKKMNSLHSNNNKLFNYLCNKLNINEKIIYNHRLFIGKNIYAYIYEKNKCTNNITFRFNLNSKDILFKNILSDNNMLRYDNNKMCKYKYLLKNINECLFLRKTKDLDHRNEIIYNYKNNILIGLLYDKENSYSYFDDKNIGDIVLCTICDISSCGKYLYLQRFESKNLIFHFRKAKYINLERNYDYDDISKLNEEILKEIM